MAWRSEDSIIVLASYFDRPPGHRLPPELELQRVANLLRVPVHEVRRRMDRFSAIDQGRSQGLPTPRDRRIWQRYRDDPAACAADAEWILEGRKRRPAWLYK